MKIDKTIDYQIRDYKFVNFVNLNGKQIKQIWEWRNHPSIRKMMYNTNEITLESHLSFVNNLINRDDLAYWLVFKDNQPIGIYDIVHIDYDNESAESGCYLIPEKLNSGIGIEFFCRSLQLLFGNDIGCKLIYGSVLRENLNAMILNNYIGYELNKEDLQNLNCKFVRVSYNKNDYNSELVEDIINLKGFAEFALQKKKELKQYVNRDKL